MQVIIVFIKKKFLIKSIATNN